MTMPKTTGPLPDRIILGIDPGTNYMGYGVVLIHQTLPKLLGMGVLDIKKDTDTYDKLKQIFDRTTQVIKQFHPTEFAIEAQFFGKNVQSMLKLGRAQGVSIAAALEQGLPITEYAPLKIKQAITGNGMAAKEQVAAMVKQYLHLKEDEMPEHLDTTDAIGVALCHYFQTSHKINGEKKFNNWNDFIKQNKQRIKTGR
jgi:crossover junction endodeoxyribonuclease RuvC